MEMLLRRSKNAQQVSVITITSRSDCLFQRELCRDDRHPSTWTEEVCRSMLGVSLSQPVPWELSGESTARHEMGKECFAIMHPASKLGTQSNSFPAANHFPGLKHSPLMSPWVRQRRRPENRLWVVSSVQQEEYVISAAHSCCLAGFSMTRKQPICSKPYSHAAALHLAPRTEKPQTGSWWGNRLLIGIEKRWAESSSA